MLPTLTGCGRSSQQRQGGAAQQQQTPPRRASVRLGSLLPAHPLWSEIGRIDAMLARLGAVSDPARSPDGAYTLPALDARPGDGEERIRRQRANEQAALRQTADANLTAFLAALEYRNSLRVAQRRDELEAILRGEIADRMRTGRAEIDAETWAGIVTASNDLPDGEFGQANLIAKRDALRNNLRTPPLLRSLTDAEKLKEDIARVDEAKKRAGQPLGSANRVDAVPPERRADPAEGTPKNLAKAQSPPEPLKGADGTPLVVSDRARVTSDLREVEARRTALAARLAALEAEGRERIARLNADLEREKDDRIAKTLAAERDQDREENLVGELREKRDEDMAREAEIAARYRASGAASGALTARGGLGNIRLADPLPVEAFGAGGAAAGGASARARLLRERQRLEAILRADVTDAVRDAAYVRNIAVTIVETTATKDDMTERFRVWIRPALDAGDGGGGASTSGDTPGDSRRAEQRAAEARRSTQPTQRYVLGGSIR